MTTRSSKFAEFTELARTMAPAALKRVEHAAKHHKDAAIRLAADKVLLERAWGKPVTPVAVDAGALGTPSFVIKVPIVAPSADAWEQAVELERTEYEAQALPAPAASVAAPGPAVETPSRASRNFVADAQYLEPSTESEGPSALAAAPAAPRTQPVVVELHASQAAPAAPWRSLNWDDE